MADLLSSIFIRDMVLGNRELAQGREGKQKYLSTFSPFHYLVDIFEHLLLARSHSGGIKIGWGEGMAMN